VRLIVAFLAIAAPLGAQCEGSDGKRLGVIRNVDPEYSESARIAGVEGSVGLRFFVGRDGIPQELTVTRPLGYGLDESAIKAVSQWRFTPCKKDTPGNVEVNFRLGGRRRFQPGPMVFVSKPETVKPVLIGFSEPDLSGSATTNATGEVEFTVDTEGHAIDFHVVKSVEPKAERSVLHALALWTFRPARREGSAVSARGTVEYHINP
jgi:TonB family protein